MYIRARQLAGCKRTGLLPAWAHKGGVLQDADTVATGGCRTPPGAWALVESHCQVNNVGTHTDACLLGRSTRPTPRRPSIHTHARTRAGRARYMSRYMYIREYTV